MVERIAPSEGAYIGLRIREDITASENDEIVHLIRQRFEQSGPVRLLVVYEAQAGLISAEDLYENMRFAKIASDRIAKMAVIGRHAWENTWIGLFGLFGGIQARHFGPDETKEALAWLSG